jgi:hypothetical protein
MMEPLNYYATTAPWMNLPKPEVVRKLLDILMPASGNPLPVHHLE